MKDLSILGLMGLLEEPQGNIIFLTVQWRKALSKIIKQDKLLKKMVDFSLTYHIFLPLI